MNGSRKPAASPTRNQPRPGPPRHADARAARRRRSCRSAASAMRGIVVGRGDGRRRSRRRRPARPPARAPPPRRPEHDPDVDPPTGHRRDADVAVANTRIRASRPRPAAGRRGGSVSPTRGSSRAGRATPAARATIEWRPSAPTTTGPRTVSGLPSGPRTPRAAGSRGRRQSRASRAGPPRPRPGQLERAGSSRDGRTRRPGRRRLGAVGQPERRPGGVSTRIAGIGRATAASVAASRPARHRAATAAGEANTPPARQRQAGARSRTTTCGRPRQPCRRTAPAGPPPTTRRRRLDGDVLPWLGVPGPLAVIRLLRIRWHARPRVIPGRSEGRDRIALAERASERPDRRQPRRSQERVISAAR